MLCSFFQRLPNKRSGTPTLELDKGIVSTFARFEYECSSSKTEQVLEEKKHDFLLFFLKKRKTTFWAGSQFYVKL